MKFSIALLSVLLAVLCVNGIYSASTLNKVEADKLNTFVRECIESTGIEIRMLQSFIKYQDKYNESKHLKCFFKCLFVKNGVLHTNGSITESYEDLKSFLTCDDWNEEEFEKENSCDKANRLRSCLGPLATSFFGFNQDLNDFYLSDS